jgi:hypothetical protein
MGIRLQNKMSESASFTEKFMSGVKNVHVTSLSNDFTSRRAVGWALLLMALGIQIGVALWMSSDLTKIQEDITLVNTYITQNKSTPNLGELQCTLDLAFRSDQAPNLSETLSSERTTATQYKVLLILLAAVFAVFGLIALSPNPFKIPNHARFAPSTTYVV